MTFDLAKLGKVTTIVTHEGCPDGIASAILLHDALPGAELRFVQYGTKAHAELRAEPGLLFCDIAPPAARFEEFIAVDALVLDHHKSARDVVDAFGDHGVFANEATEPGVSGAVLAFHHVWRPMMEATYRAMGSCFPDEKHERARELAYLAGVRDTWHRSSSDWSTACAQAEALRFFPWSEWAAIRDPFGSGHHTLAVQIGMGPTLVRKHAESVAHALSGAWRFTTAGGLRVVVFEGLRYTSDAAESLGERADLIVGFGYEVDGGTPKLILSTRSHADFDCRRFVGGLGGGGHTRAAGCSIPFGVGTGTDPYHAIANLVDRYERAEASR